MRIVFIYNGAENLGIECLSSFLKSKGHETFLLFDPDIFSDDHLVNNDFLTKVFSLDKKIVKRTIELKPDIVGFSAYTGNYQWCLRLAQDIRKLSNVPIVFGGAHPTAVPERVLANDCVDFAIVGEGEFPMLDLLEHLEKKTGNEALLNVPNICFKYQGNIHINKPRPYVKDLDQFPFPDKALFYEKVPYLERNYAIISSRGCPYDCTYCSNSLLHNLYCNEKQHVRRRSPDNIIEELSLAKKRGKMRLVVFVDDVFTSSEDWLENFVEKYKSKINLPFFCFGHPLNVTKKTVSLLKEAGCWLITMGIQSGSERIRREMFKRRGTNERIVEIVSYIKKNGIKISVDNIFGAPSETEDDLKQGLELYNKIKADRIVTFWLTYLPRTEITSYARSQNILSDKNIEGIENGYGAGDGATTSLFSIKSPSNDKKAISTYCKYQLLFHLRTLVQNDRLYYPLSRVAKIIPFKVLAAKFIIFLNAIKNKDIKFFYLLKYLWAKKNVP